MAFEHIDTLDAHNGVITSITANPAVYDQFATTGRDRSAVVWRTFPGQSPVALPESCFRSHNGIIEDAAFFPTGTHLMTASWDQSMRLWNLENKDCLERFVGHTKDILAVDVVLGRYIVSGGRDRTIRVWNIRGECQSTLEDHSDWVSCIKACPMTGAGPAQFASGSWDQTVKLWTIDEQSEATYNIGLAATLRGHNSQIRSLDYLHDGSILFTGSKDQKVAAWDVVSYNHLTCINVEEEVLCVAAQPIHMTLAVACPTCIKLYDMRANRLIHTIVPETEDGTAVPRFTTCAWTSNGDTLITGATDGQLRLYSGHQA